MAFRFFTNAIDSGAQPMPNEMYRELEQEFINLQWCNTTALYTVEEQDGIGSNHYSPVGAWVDTSVAETTTGSKNPDDFLKFIFKSIDHRLERGLMYRFNDNYWIVHSYSQFSGLAQDCGVRRCNNALRIIDPMTGALRSFPCVVDYDMASPSQQTNRYVNTPNNHAVIMVQGNEDTHRLLTTNKRFMLAGRPFKLLGFQNAIYDDMSSPLNTLMYLDLYLDEIHDGDDIELNIADNGKFDYSIVLNANDMDLLSGTTGKLTADVILNGVEVERNIVWASSDPSVVTIDDMGNYSVVGSSGAASVFAQLEGNDAVYQTVVITVADEQSLTPKIVIDPAFTKIRQYETIGFKVMTEYGGQTYETLDGVEITFDNNNGYLALSQNGDTWSLSAIKIAPEPIIMNVAVSNNIPNFATNQSFNIDVVSMMG